MPITHWSSLKNFVSLFIISLLNKIFVLILFYFVLFFSFQLGIVKEIDFESPILHEGFVTKLIEAIKKTDGTEKKNFAKLSLVSIPDLRDVPFVIATLIFGELQFSSETTSSCILVDESRRIGCC